PVSCASLLASNFSRTRFCGDRYRRWPCSLNFDFVDGPFPETVVGLTLTVKRLLLPRLSTLFERLPTRTAPLRSRIVILSAPAVGRPVTRNVWLLTNSREAPAAEA